MNTPNHAALLRRLLHQVAASGVLAFQIPHHGEQALQQSILAVADNPQWCKRMQGAKQAITMEMPDFYYDVLADECASLDIWETEQQQVMDSPQAIVEWIGCTGLRPFMDALSNESEKKQFVDLLNARVASVYLRQRNGKVLFPFRRLFVVAYRKDSP